MLLMPTSGVCVAITMSWQAIVQSLARTLIGSAENSCAPYVLEGEACYETPTRAATLRKGETLALPGGTPMRAVVTGTTVGTCWPSSSMTQPNLPPCR
jgi:hypothetical protein